MLIDIDIRDVNGHVKHVASVDVDDNDGADIRAVYTKAVLQALKDGLRAADLRGCNLSWVDFRAADLRAADLRGAILKCANFRAADLRGADLRGADVFGADFRGADLTGAKFDGAVNIGAADFDDDAVM